MTIDQAMRSLSGDFAKAGLPSARLDARLLTSHVLRVAAERLIIDFGRGLTAAQVAELHLARDRRINREPVSRICGEREFWGLSFRINEATLDPRPDSETLISALLALCDREGRRGDYLKLLDLGTGTGCLLLSALSELKNAAGVGADISLPALSLARENAASLGLAHKSEFIQSNWLDGVTGVFDFVIGNPPYIKSAEIDSLEPEVSRYDPRIALDGGASGVAAYEVITPRLRERLKPDGWALLEVGENQHECIAELLRNHGFSGIEFFQDLCGGNRVVAGKRHNPERMKT